MRITITGIENNKALEIASRVNKVHIIDDWTLTDSMYPMLKDVNIYIPDELAERDHVTVFVNNEYIKVESIEADFYLFVARNEYMEMSIF